MPFKSRLFVLFAVSMATVHAQTNLTGLGENSQYGGFNNGDSLRLPAVAQVNGKLGFAGGNMNSADGYNFEGSITLPVSRLLGFQADALYSRISDQNFYGGAGHWFWRNPDIGLIGVTCGYLSRQGVDTFQAGVEGECYLGRLTFGIFAGVGSINYANAAPFIDTQPTRFVGRISADWYAFDNLRLGVSYMNAFQDNLFGAEAEYQTPIPGVALTADVAIGDSGYDHWLLGLRYYFGGKKTLRERHRQDDPRNLMPQILYGLGVYGAEYNRKGSAYFAAHPDAGTWSGGGSYSGVIKPAFGDHKGSNGVGNGIDPTPPGGPPGNGGPGVKGSHP